MLITVVGDMTLTTMLCFSLIYQQKRSIICCQYVSDIPTVSPPQYTISPPQQTHTIVDDINCNNSTTPEPYQQRNLRDYSSQYQLIHSRHLQAGRGLQITQSYPNSSSPVVSNNSHVPSSSPPTTKIYCNKRQQQLTRQCPLQTTDKPLTAVPLLVVVRDQGGAGLIIVMVDGCQPLR